MTYGGTAGFPLPTNDCLEHSLDLNERLIPHPAGTFFMRAAGNSLISHGIHHNDLLIVDRSVAPAPGRVVVAVQDGELTLLALGERQKRPYRTYPVDPHQTDQGTDDQPADRLLIWGVITYVIHAL